MVLFELMGEGEFCQGIQLSGRKERSDQYIKPAYICVKKRKCRDTYLSGATPESGHESGLQKGN